MRYFKRAIFLAPALFTFRNAVTFSTVAVLMIPKSSCVEALPNGRKKDDDNNFFKKFTDKLPENVRSDVQELMGASATSLKSIFESGVPSQVGYGFMMGYSSGFCLKKVSRFLAFGLGGIFIIVQAMSYNGYIKVNYDGIQQDIENFLDLNKDGKVDAKDAEFGFNRIKDVLEYNMPSGGGFSAGLMMGLRVAGVGWYGIESASRAGVKEPVDDT